MAFHEQPLVSLTSHDLLLINHETHDTVAGHTLLSSLFSHLSHSLMVTLPFHPGQSRRSTFQGGKRRLIRMEAKID